MVSLVPSEQKVSAELRRDAWLLQAGAEGLRVRAPALCVDALQADAQQQQSLHGQTQEQEEMETIKFIV